MSRATPALFPCLLPPPAGQREGFAWEGADGTDPPAVRVRVRRRVDLTTATPVPPQTKDDGHGSFVYRRLARHLRARWARRPARLHRQLWELSRRHDAGEFRPPIDATPATPKTPADAFAALLAQALGPNREGGLLRYSRRQALLREAHRLGLGRFEANLQLASFEHGKPFAGAGKANRPQPTSSPRAGAVLVAAIAAAVLVQSLIALGLWHIVGH